MIQSVFRGYKTRKHLANASQAIAKFQAIYRKKKQAREDAAAVIKINKSLIESYEDQRRQELRSSRVSHLKVSILQTFTYTLDFFGCKCNVMKP